MPAQGSFTERDRGLLARAIRRGCGEKQAIRSPAAGSRQNGRPLEPDLDQQLMRGACMHQAGDPYRAVLGALASRLAEVDWTPELRPTPDFVVFIAEHDEGFAPKVESIREHNPPEQVARWEESWPPGAPRDENNWL